MKLARFSVSGIPFSGLFEDDLLRPVESIFNPAPLDAGGIKDHICSLILSNNISSRPEGLYSSDKALSGLVSESIRETERLIAVPGIKKLLLEGFLRPESAAILPPCEPGKIIAVGLNYRDHAAEFGKPGPEEPVLFSKMPGCVIPHGAPILYPAISKRVDYEAELAIIIGRDGRDIPYADSVKHILGFTCANDVTARDLQVKDGQWTRAKGFDTFLPLGPVITDSVSPDASIELTVNGAVKQRSSLDRMIFSPQYLVSFISRVMLLNKGDVIITGTPGGIGPLVPGDSVSVSISGIGTLTNEVAAVL